jgi:hypothetical protein
VILSPLVFPAISNTLTYNCTELIAAVKSFMIQAHRVNDIKIISVALECLSTTNIYSRA